MAVIKSPNQIPLFEIASSWRPPSQLPQGLHLLRELAIDTETRDPDLTTMGPSWFRGGGYVVGIVLAWRENGEKKSIYLPFAHEGGDNLDKNVVIGYVKALLSQFTGTLVFMHAMYDLGWLRKEGIEVDHSRVTVRDVMMQEALIDEHKMRYSLDSMAATYKLPPKDERLLKEAADNYGFDPKVDLWRLPARYVGPYAGQDGSLTLDVYHRQLPIIQSQALEKVVQLEHELLPCLLDMKFRGVRVDVPAAERLFKEFDEEYEKHVLEIKSITGRPIDIWSGDSCAATLDIVNVPYKVTSSGKPNIDDDWLATQKHPVCILISKARKAHAAGYRFCKGLILNHVVNGRIHCEFNPLRSDEGGTVSGRFSSSNPNLQNVPVKDPEMNVKIRGMFLPEEGEMWAAADYSQQEPRLTVHYAAELGMTGADKAAQRYTDDPNTDYHNLVAEFASIERKPAKTINLGLSYGMGGAKLCKKLGLPTVTYEAYGKMREKAGPEGQEILDKYYAAVPFVKELSDHYTGVAKRDGQIRTLAGRLCRFGLWGVKYGSGRTYPTYDEAVKNSGPGSKIERAMTYQALNRKIQGGSADMIKIAMRNMHRKGIIPLVTVHDEIGWSVKSVEEAKVGADIMRNCVKLRVPMKVDIDIGPSWGLAKPFKDEESL